MQESQYARSLIEASLDPLVTINTHGKITDMNQALANITGMSRMKLTGTDFFDYFTEPQKAREVYQIVFAKGTVADFPLILRHVNEKLTDVLFNGSVYKDDRGKVLGAVVVHGVDSRWTQAVSPMASPSALIRLSISAFSMMNGGAIWIVSPP